MASKLELWAGLRGSGLTSTEYHVLMTLASYADSELRNAFPSVATLCADTGLSKSTVKRTLHVLSEKGFLVLEEEGGNGRGHRRANKWTIVHKVIPKGFMGEPLGDREGVHPRTLKGFTGEPLRGSPTNPHQVIDQVIESAADHGGADDSSDEPPDLVPPLQQALLSRGLKATWQPIRGQLRNEVRDLIRRHGVAALVDAAVAAHQPNDPARTAKAWLAIWRAMPDPVEVVSRIPVWCGRATCNPSTRLLEDDTGPFRRCPQCHPLAAARDGVAMDAG